MIYSNFSFNLFDDLIERMSNDESWILAAKNNNYGSLVDFLTDRLNSYIFREYVVELASNMELEDATDLCNLLEDKIFYKEKIAECYEYILNCVLKNLRKDDFEPVKAIVTSDNRSFIIKTAKMR